MPDSKHKFKGKLVSKKKETEDVVTLSFKFDSHGEFSFIPGQYAVIYFEDKLGPNGKAYTISNTPDDKFFDVTVKKIGKFSTALHELKIGETVTMEGPVGYFFPEGENKELVFLAAGIGITPFLSIIRSYVKNNSMANKKISLFYSNKTKGDIVFFNELNELSENKNMKVHYYLTREKIKDKHIKEFSRINIESIESKLDCLENKDYFICGPISFVADLRRAILNKGIGEINIHTESFY